MHYCQIQRNFRDSEYLCKLGKEYLNTLLCKFYNFFLDKICKLLTYHTPFYHWLSQSYQHSKMVQFFGPPCITVMLPHVLRCRRLDFRKEWKSTFSTTPISSLHGTPANIRINFTLSVTRVVVLVAAVCCLGHVKNYDWLIDWLIDWVIGLRLRRCMGLSSFKFSRWAPKDAYVLKQSAKWPFKVIQGRWFWRQSKARIWLPSGQQ